MAARSKISWIVASRYMFQSSGEAFIRVLSWISLLAVALSVGILVIVMSIMGGFEFELKSKIIGTNAHVTIRSFTERIRNAEEIVSTIEEHSQVQSASAYTYNQALIRTADRVSGILIKGIPRESEGTRVLRDYVAKWDPTRAEGEIFAPPESEEGPSSGIVIGKELSRSLEVGVGDVITLLAPEMGATPFGLSPRFRRFVVSAIYNSGLVEYESGLAYLDISEAQRFFRMGTEVSAIDVRLEDANRAQRVSLELTRSLREKAAQPIVAQSWQEANPYLWEALALEKRVYFLVLLLLIVLASFSVVSGLVMLVIEKKRDVAILRTMGATKWQISRIFRLQGCVLGFLGTALGILLGLAGCWALQRYGFPLPEGIFPVDTVPVRVEPMDVAAISVASLLIAFLATLYPSYRAASFHPAETLRHE